MPRIMPDESVLAKYLIKTHGIFKVVTFHPENQTVDIIQDVYDLSLDPLGKIVKENEFDIPVAYSLNIPKMLYDIPVKQLRWGQFSIECCPKKGDTGYVEYFHDDIRDWMKDGGVSVPDSAKKFIPGSCIFVPFVPNLKNLKEDYVDSESKLRIKSKNAMIEIIDEDNGHPIINIISTGGTTNITATTTNVNGNLKVTGEITADGNIKSKSDVLADGISLKDHTHGFTYIGAGTGSSPQTGTTEAP